jgi:hypothetical protein
MVTFRLPADWKSVMQVMNRDQKIPPRYKTNEQAKRAAQLPYPFRGQGVGSLSG